MIRSGKNTGIKLVLCSIFFLIVLTSNEFYPMTHAQLITLNNSGQGINGRMFYPDFIQTCEKNDYIDNSGGDFQDLQGEIIMNFETETITGTLEGRYQWDHPKTKQDNTVKATLNGLIVRTNKYGDANSWYWEFTGDVDFTLDYHMEILCEADSGDYWETKDETLNVKGEITGSTWGASSWGWINLYWEDRETIDGRPRYVHILPDSQSFDIELPDPVDLDVSITMSDEVNLNSDTTPFQLNLEGTDVNLIDHFGWYFAYWEPDLELYRGLQNEQRFETRGQNPLEVTDAMRDEWRRLANEYGFEAEGGAEIDLQINLRTFDAEGNDLVENYAFNYTYFTTSDASSETSSSGEGTSTSETGTGSNPLIIPDVSTSILNLSGTLIQGAVSAGAGFGIVEMFRRFFGEKPRNPITSSDLRLLKEKMKDLPPEPEQLGTSASQGEDVLRLPTEDKYQKRDRRRSSIAYRRLKKQISDDGYYRQVAESKNWSPEQERAAIRAAKPSWVNAYSEELTSKREGIWLNSKKYWEHYKTLSDSEKAEVDNWKRWDASWIRRHGPGNVGKMSEGSAAQFTATTAGRG